MSAVARRRQRLVRIAVDLAGAGVDQRPLEAGHRVGTALVEVHGDDADRADLAGAA